jgi:prepilin signal peptidase PulO-like enzyme (type II secretory pathway)
MAYAVTTLLALIAVIDCRTHRIPNSTLALLAVFVAVQLLVSPQPVFLVKRFLFLLLLAIVFDVVTHSAVGMGDLKLLLLLSFFIPDSRNLIAFLVCLSLACVPLAFTSLAFHLNENSMHLRSSQAMVPFAPAIFAAFFVSQILLRS